MTRPQMIRADTIDLQDHVSPSAKDHSRQGKHATPEGGARHAPHQDQSIRDAERDSLDEMARGPVGPQGQRDMYGHGYSDQDDLIDDITRLGNGQANHDITSDETTEDDNLADGDGDDQFDDDLLDRISSSPSIDDEDIDFEFVYALHTFVATVEGQANASKGDTMVLLDDSNSYWWLVRVVKDGSIGYLPAEHIETPTERLARLNKHRNVDLSATMLGDNAEKSKNPLKKAMRRRNAKTVTFTSPTYFDAPEVDYSTEEEEDEDNFFEEDEGSRVDPVEDMSDDVDVTIEPLRPKQHHHSQQDQQHQDIRSVMESPSESDDVPELAATPSDDRPASDIQEQPAHGKSRNGTVRNTDSFFKDDTAETKKISLTPNLLRDDTSSATYYEQRDAAGRGSLESFDKTGHSGEKNKDDKKRKDKKPGMLSGLFKRKDRKHRAADDDTDSSEKISGESTRSYTPPKSSSESLKDETRTTTTPSKPHASVQRTASKLQKALPSELSPIKETGTTGSTLSSPITDSQPSSLRVVQEQPEPEDLTSGGYLMPSQSGDQKELSSESPAKAIVTDAPTTHSDASPNMSEYNDHADTKGTLLVEGTSKDQSGRHRDNWNAGLQGTRESGGISTEERAGSALSPSPSSPVLHGTQEQKRGDKSEQEQPLTGPAWSDASLRAYLEDGSDIRDLLTIIYDKSNVVPTGADHPIIGPLFKEESKALCEMSSRLDGMLNSWLTRKGLSCVR